MATDLLALALLTPPGELGADIAIGLGPALRRADGLWRPACRLLRHPDEYKRAMPGRIIGVSVDAEGHRALRMALQTREQHIRREKATSNICTAQVLLAVIAAHVRRLQRAQGHPEDGRAHPSPGRDLRRRRRRASATRWRPRPSSTRSPSMRRAAPTRSGPGPRRQRINLRFVDADHLGISFDQSIRRQELERLLTVFSTDALERRSRSTRSTRTLKEVIPRASAPHIEPISPIRSSRCITRKPRCCAICAICR